MSQSPTVTGFPDQVIDITPSDSANLTGHDGKETSMQVQSVDGGDVAVLPAGNPSGQTFVFTVPAGLFVPCQVKQVLSTGTDSSDILGYY